MSEQGTMDPPVKVRRTKLRARKTRTTAKGVRVEDVIDYSHKPDQLSLLKKVKDGFRRRWIRAAGHQAELNVETKKYRGYEVITSTMDDPIGPQRRGDLILARIPERLAKEYERNVSRRSGAAVEAAERSAHMQLRRQGLRTFEGDDRGRDHDPDLGNRLDRIRAAEMAGIDPDRVVDI